MGLDYPKDQNMDNILNNLSKSSDYSEFEFSMLEAVYSTTPRPSYGTILRLSRQLKGDCICYLKRWFRNRRDIDREESKTEANADISTTSKRTNDRVPPIIFHIHHNRSFSDAADIAMNHCI